MNKAQMVAKLAKQTGLTKVRAHDAIEALFDPETGIIAGAMLRESVVFVGFGTFRVKTRAARYVTPPYGVRTLIPPKKAVFFKASAMLNTRLRL
jgi:DNA-binding protein HU-beta